MSQGVFFSVALLVGGLALLRTVIMRRSDVTRRSDLSWQTTWRAVVIVSGILTVVVIAIVLAAERH